MGYVNACSLIIIGIPEEMPQFWEYICVFLVLEFKKSGTMISFTSSVSST